MLEIKKLCASAGEKEILKGLDLKINKGEVHVIMGPNGAGKSTLANVIFNNPEYKITDGSIKFKGKIINDYKTDEVARSGIFMSHQTPEEIEGISVVHFLKSAKEAITGNKVNIFEFRREINKYCEELDIKDKYLSRDLNVGFSGGEKKKQEILQMLTLNPSLAILDETDSGLDVDAANIVSKGINMFKNKDNAVLLITHSNRIIKNLDVDYVHILVDGKIVKTGDISLALEIEENGYKNYLGEKHEN